MTAVHIAALVDPLLYYKMDSFSVGSSSEGMLDPVPSLPSTTTLVFMEELDCQASQVVFLIVVSLISSYGEGALLDCPSSDPRVSFDCCFA